MPEATLKLSVGGRIIELSSITEDTITVGGEFHPLPPCDADIVIQVGEFTTTQRIWLPEGLQGSVSPFEKTSTAKDRAVMREREAARFILADGRPSASDYWRSSAYPTSGLLVLDAQTENDWLRVDLSRYLELGPPPQLPGVRIGQWAGNLDIEITTRPAIRTRIEMLENPAPDCDDPDGELLWEG